MIPANIHSCTCPEATHTANKKRSLRIIWKSPEWIRESTAYRARTFPFCSRCFRVAPIVPGHSGEDYTPSEMKRYVEKVRQDRVVPLCHQCNRMEAKVRHPCPVCITKHREDPDHYIRYIGQDQELCYSCERGGAGRPDKKAGYLNRHTCDWHGRGQFCGDPLRYGTVCPYSALKAGDKCDHFMARKQAAVAKAGAKA